MIQFLNEPLIRTVKNKQSKRNKEENNLNLNSDGNSLLFENNLNLLRNDRISNIDSYDYNNNFSDFLVGAKCTIELETRKYLNSRRSNFDNKDNHIHNNNNNNNNINNDNSNNNNNDNNNHNNNNNNNNKAFY